MPEEIFWILVLFGGIMIMVGLILLHIAYSKGMVGTDSSYDTFINDIKQHNKLVKKHRIKCVNAIIKAIEKHYKTLENKYEQSTYTDDYGYERFDKEAFYREIADFTNNVLPNETDIMDSTIKRSYHDLCDELFDNKPLLKRFYNCEFANSEEEVILDWLIYTFFCFSLKLNKNESGDVFISDDKGNIIYGFNIVEYSLSQKKEMCLKTVKVGDTYLTEPDFYTADEQYCKNLYNLVEYIFTAIKIWHDTSDENKIRKAPSNPIEYEKYIATLLKNLDFNAHPTKASGDQGADVIAEKNGVKFAIQCKMYSKPVGNKAVQEANAGRDFYKCEYGVVVSNAGFTKSAKQAAHACNIILLNDKQLEKLLNYTKK